MWKRGLVLHSQGARASTGRAASLLGKANHPWGAPCIAGSLSLLFSLAALVSGTGMPKATAEAAATPPQVLRWSRTRSRRIRPYSLFKVAATLMELKPTTGAAVACKAGATTCAMNTVCSATLTSNGDPTIASFTLAVGSSANRSWAAPAEVRKQSQLPTLNHA